MTKPIGNATEPDTNSIQHEDIFPDGFLALHNGLRDHLQDGRMTPAMLAVYIVLQYQVEWSSGRWNGNAHRIYAAFGGKLSLSQIRKILTTLEKRGYIRRFKKQGMIGNYFVLIDKYRVRLGELRGRILNAAKSTSWKDPVYEAGSDREVMRVSEGSDVRVTRVSEGSDVRPYQEEQDVQDVQDSQKAQEAKPTNQPSADGRTDGPPSPKSKMQNLRASQGETLTVWMSELLAYRLEDDGVREQPVPTKGNRKTLGDLLAEEENPLALMLAFMKFANRSKGFSGLNDIYGLFFQEWQFTRAAAYDALGTQANIEAVFTEAIENLSFYWGKRDSARLIDVTLSSARKLSASVQPTGEAAFDCSELDLASVPELNLNNVAELR